jgi:hypothetical protein
MKLKSILGVIVSALVIMLGGFVLFNLAFVFLGFLVNGMEGFMDSGGEATRGLLLLGGFVALVVALTIVAKFLITKEQLKHTLLASILALLLMVVLILIGIVLYGQSDIIILLAGSLIIIPLLILLYLKKANWTYIFATVFASFLGILVMLFNIEI